MDDNSFTCLLTGMFHIDDVDGSEVVTDSSPSTLLQLKLASGKKLRLKLNHSHTVRDIVRHIKKDGSTVGPFSLRFIIISVKCN